MGVISTLAIVLLKQW